MRRDIQGLLPLLLLLLPLAAHAASRPDARSGRLIVPGIRLGPIIVTSSMASLRATYGIRNVITENVLAEDGSRVPGAILYPGDPQRRVEIAWSDTLDRRHPAWARVRGPASAWHTPAGVRLGTSLIELEKINGRAFTIWGFGTERPGQIRSWNDGALAAEMRKRAAVSLRLPSHATAREIAAVSQGEIFPSGDPGLRRLNPRVGEIVVRFDPQRSN